MPTVRFQLAPAGVGECSSSAALEALLTALRTEKSLRIGGGLVSDLARTDPLYPEPEVPTTLAAFQVRVTVRPPSWDATGGAEQREALEAVEHLSEAVQRAGSATRDALHLAGVRVDGLRSLKGADLDVRAASPQPPRRYRARRRAMVRSGIALDSPAVGTLRKGEEIVALETGVDPHFGTTRVRFERLGGESGWASDTAGGSEKILVRCGRGFEDNEQPEADVLGSAREAAANSESSEASRDIKLVEKDVKRFCHRCGAVFCPDADGCCPEGHAQKFYTSDIPVGVETPIPAEAEKEEETTELLPRFLVLKLTQVRCGFDMTSAKNGVVQSGIEVHALEVRTLDSGVRRVRIGADEWISEHTSKGEKILKEIPSRDAQSAVPEVEPEPELESQAGSMTFEEAEKLGVGELHRVLHPLQVRAGCDGDSPKICMLQPGSEIDVIERGEDWETGIVRLRCKWQQSDGRSVGEGSVWCSGWVSERRADNQLLVEKLANETEADNKRTLQEELYMRYNDPQREIQNGTVIGDTGWYVFKTEEGQPYFFCKDTQETTWDEPPAVQIAVLSMMPSEPPPADPLSIGDAKERQQQKKLALPARPTLQPIVLTDDVAATRVQALYRGWRERHMTWSCSHETAVLQALVLRKVCRQEYAQRKSDYFIAATRLQSIQRGRSARLQLAQSGELTRRAALREQTQTALRRAVAHLSHRSTAAAWRQWVDMRRQHLIAKRAVLSMQHRLLKQALAAWAQFLQQRRRAQAALVHMRNRCVLPCLRQWAEVAADRKAARMEELRQRQDEAAICIQAAFRGVRSRQYLRRVLPSRYGVGKPVRSSAPRLQHVPATRRRPQRQVAPSKKSSDTESSGAESTGPAFRRPWAQLSAAQQLSAGNIGMTEEKWNREYERRANAVGDHARRTRSPVGLRGKRSPELQAVAVAGHTRPGVASSMSQRSAGSASRPTRWQQIAGLKRRPVDVYARPSDSNGLHARTQQQRCGQVNLLHNASLADLRREIEIVGMAVPRPFGFLEMFTGLEECVLPLTREAQIMVNDLEPPGSICVVQLQDAPTYAVEELALPISALNAAMAPPRHQAPSSVAGSEQLRMPVAAEQVIGHFREAQGLASPTIRYWKYVFERMVITGYVYNLAGHPNGAPVTTSTVVQAQGRIFTTKSGSRYVLEEPEYDFRKSLEASGLYQPDNPLQPLLAMQYTSKQLSALATMQETGGTDSTAVPESTPAAAVNAAAAGNAAQRKTKLAREEDGKQQAAVEQERQNAEAEKTRLKQQEAERVAELRRIEAEGMKRELEEEKEKQRLAVEAAEARGRRNAMAAAEMQTQAAAAAAEHERLEAERIKRELEEERERHRQAVAAAEARGRRNAMAAAIEAQAAAAAAATAAERAEQKRLQSLAGIPPEWRCGTCEGGLLRYEPSHPQFSTLGELEDWHCDVCEKDYEQTDKVKIIACRDFETCDWCVCSACVWPEPETKLEPEPEPEMEPEPGLSKLTASGGGLLSEFRRAQGIPAGDLLSSSDEECGVNDGGRNDEKEEPLDDEDSDWPRRSDSSERFRRNYRAGIAGLLEQCREFYQQDRPAECLVIATKILDNYPQHEVALTVKGWALMRQRQDLADARDAFQRAGLVSSADGNAQVRTDTQRASTTDAGHDRLVAAAHRRGTAGAARSAPRQAMYLAAQRAYAKQQRITGAVGMPSEWDAAALVHAVRDNAAILIQCHYRGSSVRRRWQMAAATALVHDIVRIERLRGVSLSWRVSKSQLVAKKRQLVDMLSSPTARVAGAGPQQNEHSAIAQHLQDGQQREGVQALGSSGGGGYWGGYGHGDPVDDMMRTAALWGQPPLPPMQLPPPAMHGSWVPSRPPLVDMSARYLNGPPPRGVPAVPFETVPPGGPRPHGYQQASYPPQPLPPPQQHQLSWYGSGY